jgi:hypothetical protein
MNKQQYTINMGWFNFGKKEVQVSVDNYQTFSTPFGKIGKGNLSLPYITDQYTGGGGYVLFGNDNLYPQLLNQLYYMSPLHSSIVNFTCKATVGGGYELGLNSKTAQDKVDYFTWENKLRLSKTIEATTLDLILHKRVYFIVNSSKGTSVRVAPEKVRTNKDKSVYFICDDWSRQINIRPIKPYHVTCKDKEQLYVYETYSVGQDIYALPSYTSASNWIFLDGDMSNLHKANIQNSIFPSFALMFPKKFQNDEEKRDIKNTVEKAKGSSEAGKVIVFSAQGKEFLPEIAPIPTNQNDKLFIETDEQINLKICQAHTIDPMLMGVRVSGKLGGGSDIKQSYIIWEKNTVLPLREEVQNIYNDLLAIAGLKPSFILNEFQIINETIIEQSTEGNKITDALNSMSPLVATKVLEALTVNEIRALAGLSKVEGGDELPTSQETEVQPTFNVS